MSNEIALEKQCGTPITGEHLFRRDFVLIVDDNEDILELGAEVLQALGYDVITARNGFEAIPVLRDNSRISILFTDIEMPGIGGEDLARIAALLRPDLPVIFTSGSARPHADVPFIQKPYGTADLIRVLPRRCFGD